ncbi:iron-containing redox enzyme family protein [Saccharothrix obliqua]|uniref:iron-containing redox enzyme family protein n=1 Tax=Saccharothrix obliqua TaxID=2861747 RepID=UPI001C5E0BF8|nr:iron-containing redox enzyme family protein [Saccharothrix obliqua]MBW4718194.1 iron-containing redox enzyme family protein [Saccharothrix obliqua]
MLQGLETAALPAPRGPVSDAVITALRSAPPARFAVEEARRADPHGEDLQLALHVCYELHYRGFRDVSADWEWEPELIRLRTALEGVFRDALHAELPGRADIGEVLDELLVEPVDGHGVSHHLRDRGEWWQMREYLVHRSIYHLKEADPHAWVIPRLTGRAKAALVAVEFDEFGGGRDDRMHSQLYARLLTGAGLEPGYLHYLDHVPAPMLATVNLMSMCGLHRGLRGALVGHFAAAEISTAPSATRMAKALRRMNAHPDCVEFFTEHIEADAVHEQVMRHDVVGDLVAREPELVDSVVFGVRATELLEQRLADHLLGAWAVGRSSLIRPV